MLWGLILLFLLVVVAALLWRQRQQHELWELELMYLTRHQKGHAEPLPETRKINVPPVYRQVRKFRQQFAATSAPVSESTPDDHDIPSNLAESDDWSDLPIFATPQKKEAAISPDDNEHPGSDSPVPQAVETTPSPDAGQAAGEILPSEKTAWDDPFFEQDHKASVLTRPRADLSIISADEVLRRIKPHKPEPQKQPLPLKVIEAADVQRFRQKQAETHRLPEHKTRTVKQTHHQDIAAILAQNNAQVTPHKPSTAIRDGEIETISAEDIRANLLRRRMARRNDDWDEPIPPPQPVIIQQSEILANLAHSDSPANRLRHKAKRQMVRESIIPPGARIHGEHTVNPNAENNNPPISTRFTPYNNTSRTITPPVSMAQHLQQPSIPEEVPAEETWEETLARAQAESRTSGVAENDWRNAFKTEQATRINSGRAILPEAQPAGEDIWVQYESPPAEPCPTIDTTTPWDNFQATADHKTGNEFDYLADATTSSDTDNWAEKKTPFPVENNFSAFRQPRFYHTADLLPHLALLSPPQFDPDARQSDDELLQKGITIEEKLAEFKVKVNVMDAYAGPVITRYEIEPDTGVRGNQVLNLEKDLARALGCASIRIVETIPGKTCMGLELPNPKRQTIRLSEILGAQVFTESKSKLTLALGHDITGQPVVTDLARAPHLLVAGTTGSGKSVGVNAMILSILFKATPEEVRLIMIDPKMLELSVYEGIPHLLAPVVTDMKLAANALTWCVNEMEKRYRLMSHLGVRNLAGFNQRVSEAADRGKKIGNPFSLTPLDPEPLEKLPFIVVVVDEFADLMMTAGKKIEELIARLAQKARAAGIHLILATQRPSVDVITGLIKANIPTRIAFQVSSKVDSRTIIDQMGAENLLGQGDMLFLPPGSGYPQRIHGAFAGDEEVHRVAEYLKQFGEPNYVEDILTAGVGSDDLFSNASGQGNDGEDDPLYDEAVAIVIKTRKASISSVQRHLRIGYNRAARLVDQMEQSGVVSAPEHNGNRTVLVNGEAE